MVNYAPDKTAEALACGVRWQVCACGNCRLRRTAGAKALGHSDLPMLFSTGQLSEQPPADFNNDASEIPLSAVKRHPASGSQMTREALSKPGRSALAASS